MGSVYRLALLAVGFVALSGCQAMMYRPLAHHGPETPPANVEPTATFDAANLQARMVAGHGIIRGQAFSKTRGGDVKYGAGNVIVVWPVTDYTTQCLQLINSPQTTSCGEKIKPYAKTVQADGEGRFEVDDVQPGTYVLFTLITWSVPGPFGLESTGGLVSGQADIKDDTQIVTTYLN